MTSKSGAATSDYWRNYFRSVNSDIFDVIENAILVAATDSPKEFILRRDGIAEKLFTCTMKNRCSGCDTVGSSVPQKNGDASSKESKVNNDQGREMHVSSYSFGEAEALTNEIEEESQFIDEVFRIKKVLENSDDETDSSLFDSLRRLQLMPLTVDNLKATEIGKAVNGIRKHGSKEIRNLAKTLIDLWKEMVDEWVNATASLATEGTPDSVNPSVLDEEEGLPSPPLDEAFFATQHTTMELSQFFDGMDDDGNPQNYGPPHKNRENGRRASLENQRITNPLQKSGYEANVVRTVPQVKKQEALVKPKPNKPLNTESGPGRPPRVGNEMKQKPDKVSIQKRPLNTQQDNKVESMEVKLEAAKRKLHERYQQADNAKKQRTIQVMDLHELPKPKQQCYGGNSKNQHMKPGLHNRQFSTGRR